MIISVLARGCALVLLACAAATAAFAANPWTPTGPFAGALLPSIAYSANGATVFAGGLGVVYRSTNDGESWTAAALPAKYARSLVEVVAPDPTNESIVLASTADVGAGGVAAGNAVLVSDDGGKTWAAGAGLNGIGGATLSWDPNVAGTVYASASGEIFRSTNSGKNWSQRYQQTNIDNPVPFGAMAAVPTKPTSIYIAATDFNYADDGDEYIAKSTNGAGSFSFVDPLNYVGYPGYGLIFTQFAYNPKAPATVYALVSGYQSDTITELPEYIEFLWTPNGGTNWVNRVKGLPLNAEASTLAVEPVSGTVLLPVCCADHHQLFQSANQGQSWTALGTIQATSLALAVKPGGVAGGPVTILNAGRGGALGSTNGGVNWSGRNTGLTQPSFTDVIVDPTNPQLIYAATKSGVWRSINGGTSFAVTSSGITDGNVQALALDAKASPHVLYAATLTGIYRCGAPGATTPAWTEITPPSMRGFAGAYTLAVDGGAAGRLYVSNSRSVLLANGNVTQREIYRTDTYGATWVTTGFNSTTGNDFPGAMVADPKTPGTLYASATDFQSIYKSVDAGKSFTQVDGQGATKLLIGQGDALNPRTVYALSTDPNSGGAEILRSTDGGKIWDSNTTASPGGGTLLDLATDPKTSALYALVYLTKTTVGINPTYSYNFAVYQSPNRGFTWTAITGNLAVPLTVQPSAGVTTNPLMRATGDVLALGLPLEKTLYLQKLP